METTAQVLPAAPAPGRSQGRARRRRGRGSSETTRSPKAILHEIQMEAIRQERTRREKLRGQIDRSARGGSGSVGGYGGGARQWPEQGGGHGGDAIATGSREVRVRTSERERRVSVRGGPLRRHRATMGQAIMGCPMGFDYWAGPNRGQGHFCLLTIIKRPELCQFLINKIQF